MSEDSDFDKEAEREKLRKQYEADKKGRESTQRMSELLLQGATMTGKHCNNCGDPIFRYDGQEFCPSCQHASGEAAQAEDAETPEQTDAAEATVTGDAAEPDGDVDVRMESGTTTTADADSGAADSERAAPDDAATGNEPRVEINDVRVADRHSHDAEQHSHDADRRQPSAQTGRSTRDGEAGAGRERRERRARSNRSSGTATGTAANGDLDGARASLVRKLTDLAQQAEATDDVTRSRELLAATREAAEALDALDRANR